MTAALTVVVLAALLLWSLLANLTLALLLHGLHAQDREDSEEQELQASEREEQQRRLNLAEAQLVIAEFQLGRARNLLRATGLLNTPTDWAKDQQAGDRRTPEWTEQDQSDFERLCRRQQEGTEQ